MCACVCVFERAVLARAGRGPLCRSLSSLLTPAPPLYPHTSLYTSSTDTLNNAFARLWWGKVAYNDGTNPNVTQMWNLMFSNRTVSLTGAAYVADSSWLTNDGRPSVMLDYTDTNNIAFREMYDEMRYMANGVWLGRIWWGIPTNSFRKTSYTKLGEVKDRAVLAALNATAVHASVWGSLVGESSRAEVTMDGKFPLGWFAMQCAGPQVRKKGRRGERMRERERERERVGRERRRPSRTPTPHPRPLPFSTLASRPSPSCATPPGPSGTSSATCTTATSPPTTACPPSTARRGRARALSPARATPTRATPSGPPRWGAGTSGRAS